MKEQRIIVEIGRDGRITADAEGFSGGACLRDLEQLLSAVGGPLESVESKGDPGARQTRRQQSMGLGRKDKP